MLIKIGIVHRGGQSLLPIENLKRRASDGFGTRAHSIRSFFHDWKKVGKAVVQFLLSERLENEAGNAAFKAFVLFIRQNAGRYGQDRGAAAHPVQDRGRFQPVHDRHLDIHENQVVRAPHRHVFHDQLHALASVLGNVHDQAQLTDVFFQHDLVDKVVLAY